MNSEEIYRCLKNNPFTRDKFLDVVASDQLPHIYDKNKEHYIVVNYDPSYKEGSHWVVIKKSLVGSKDIFFDSYGWKPKLSHFESYMNFNYEYNKVQLQNDFATTCGQWCCFFILNQVMGINLTQMIKKINKFTDIEKDHIINYFVENIFNTDQEVIDKTFLFQQTSTNLKKNQYLRES